VKVQDPYGGSKAISLYPVCIREKLPSTRFGHYMCFAVLGRNSLIQLLAECVLFPFIPLLCRMALVGFADKVVN
jgi:hypothetical protein